MMAHNTSLVIKQNKHPQEGCRAGRTETKKDKKKERERDREEEKERKGNYRINISFVI